MNHYRWIAMLLVGMGVMGPAVADDAESEPKLILIAQDDAAPAAERPEPDRREGPRPDRERMQEMRDRREREGDAQRRGPFGPMRPLTEEQVPQVLSVLGDVNPDLARRFETGLAGDHPERVRRQLDRMGPPLLELYELKQNDPQAYDLRLADNKAKLQTIRLVRAINQARRAGNEEKVAELKEELRAHLDKHFEIRQQLRERELAHLEKRIEKLRAELEEHRANKGELIDETIENLTRPRPRGDRAEDSDDDPAEDMDADE